VTRLADFNALPGGEADHVLRPCLDIDRWVDELVRGRPYPSVGELLDRAGRAASPFTTAEVEAALRHHPRIGEGSGSSSAGAAFSRDEQGGVARDPETLERLAEANRRYEERFGRVFLVRAAGRGAEDVLAALVDRLGNDAGTEERVVADQLREIAVLRLAQVVST
jgi:2-oxo-4-hydroxy-4-carboxy-5-ureidoimidazoline decarboxylase